EPIWIKRPFLVSVMRGKKKGRKAEIDPDAFKGVSGARAKALRTRLGLTVREVASKAPVSTTTLLKFEAGEPVRLLSLRRICYALGVMPDQLIDPKAPFDAADPLYTVRDQDSPIRIAYVTEAAPRAIKELAEVEDPLERKRLAALGFVAGYFQLIQNER